MGPCASWKAVPSPRKDPYMWAALPACMSRLNRVLLQFALPASGLPQRQPVHSDHGFWNRKVFQDPKEGGVTAKLRSCQRAVAGAAGSFPSREGCVLGPLVDASGASSCLDLA